MAGYIEEAGIELAAYMAQVADIPDNFEGLEPSAEEFALAFVVLEPELEQLLVVVIMASVAG